jgi:hypothetical protein
MPTVGDRPRRRQPSVVPLMATPMPPLSQSAPVVLQSVRPLRPGGLVEWDFMTQRELASSGYDASYQYFLQDLHTVSGTDEEIDPLPINASTGVQNLPVDAQVHFADFLSGLTMFESRGTQDFYGDEKIQPANASRKRAYPSVDV